MHSRAFAAVRTAAVPLRALATATPAQQALLASRVQSLGLSARAFSQARAVLNAAAPPAPKAESAVVEKKEATSTEQKAVASASSFSEIVQRYGGWYPFLGLAGVIAVSKEVIVLNEELLLVSNFAAMFATLYFALGDTVTKAAEEQRAEIAKAQDDISDFEIEQIRALIQAHELNVGQVDVLKGLKTQHNELSSSLATARALKVRHAARDALIKRLGDVRAREQGERASFKLLAAERATKYVQKTFGSLPANQKAALIDHAIAVVEGKATQLEVSKDPVKQLYTKFFDEELYNKEQ